jgi:MoxR-like ATPase
MTEQAVSVAHARAGDIVRTVSAYFVGDVTLLRKLLAGALANGHVLFEDYPGLGKTLLVKVFAKAIGCTATRIQFTPDILPADILGTKVWSARDGAFRLHKGPVFANVILADEINRAPPKTQSALLEAMDERQVTIEGDTMKLESPFFVLATQNPIEQEGTYPLPEAQMDRFLLKMSTWYPRDVPAEREILKRRIAWLKDDPTEDVQPVVTLQEFRALQVLAENGVFVHDQVLDYMCHLVRGVRDHAKVEVGPSPRGTLALLRLSRALALVHGRDFVTPDDVKGIAVEALAHRTLLEMDEVVDGARPETIVKEVLDATPAPTHHRRAKASDGARAAPTGATNVEG